MGDAAGARTGRRRPMTLGQPGLVAEQDLLLVGEVPEEGPLGETGVRGHLGAVTSAKPRSPYSSSAAS